MLLLASCTGTGGTDEVQTAAQDQEEGKQQTPDPREELCFTEGERFEGEARLYIEHNATDKDTGVHGMFDQEGLAEGCIQTPEGTQMMLIDPTDQLGDLGINQFFFESREPPNDEYSIADLKADFPEGRYTISGIDYEGTERVGAAVLTHDIPRPARIIAPRIVDEEDGGKNVVSTERLVVRWEPVAETVAGLPVDISGYEVIVTKAKHKDRNSLSQPEYDVHVPPTTRQLEVPSGFFIKGALYELEVLALEKSGNQTISVGFFTAG